MSMLHEIYRAQRGRQRDDIVVLSKPLKDELLCCAGLLVVTCFNLRLKPSKLLVATDASSTTRAAVAAEIGAEATKELRRHGLEKAWLREHLMLQADEELPDEDSYKMHPVWEEIVCSQPFEKFGQVRRRQGREHINVGEVAAALEAEREHGRRWPGHFFINLQDSQVGLACLVKGRSSSWQINKLLRQSIPDVCAYDSRAFYGYVRSKLNPEDDPTRGVSVREPVRCEAAWLTDLKQGRFEKFDGSLEEWELSLERLADLPSKQLKEERGRKGRVRKSSALSELLEEEKRSLEGGRAFGSQPPGNPEDKSPCQCDRWCLASEGSSGDGGARAPSSEEAEAAEYRGRRGGCAEAEEKSQKNRPFFGILSAWEVLWWWIW